MGASQDAHWKLGMPLPFECAERAPQKWQFILRKKKKAISTARVEVWEREMPVAREVLWVFFVKRR